MASQDVGMGMRHDGSHQALKQARRASNQLTQTLALRQAPVLHIARN